MNNNRYIIGIGAQKSGTTWLANYLAKHPQVLVSPVKELHFFDNVYRPDICSGLERRQIKKFLEMSHNLQASDIKDKTLLFKQFNDLSDRVRIGNDIENYKYYFISYAKRKSVKKSVFCDITPEYALLDKRGFEAIKSLADDVRLIFLIRNPVDRFWSAVRMWSKEKKNVNIVSDLEMLIDKSNFVIRTEYDKTLSTVYDIFPKERVYVQFYEHLFNPDVIAQLCTFCDINFAIPNTQKRVLEGIHVPLSIEMRALIYKKFSPIYDWADAEFGENLPLSWRTDINRFGK